ncbi:MAG: biotin/lipoyl-binding protein [Kistimonas sp.]|nr:biotin/lipoyl-binding protein [Kistimonas sp.]
MAVELSSWAVQLKTFLRHRRWALLAIVLTCALLVLFHAGADHAGRQSAPPSPPRVETVPVAYAQEEYAQVRLYGKAETPARVTLTSTIAARVLATPILAGQPVKTGDLLISLDRRDLELQLVQREAEVKDVQARMRSELLRTESEKKSLEQERVLLEVARRDWERQRALGKEHQVSDSQIDAARSALARQRITVIERQLQVADQQNRAARLQAQQEQAESARAQVQLDLERSQIKADFDGWLIQLSVAEGDQVHPGEALAQVYPADAVEIRAQVPNRYLPRLRQAQAAGQPIKAQLEESSAPPVFYMDRLMASVEEGRGGVDAVFRPASDQPLPVVLGQSVVIKLQVPLPADTLRVQPGCLYDDRYVYRLDKDNKLEAVSVERRGLRTVAGQEVLLISSSALSEGDRLLKTRLSGALTGLLVSPVDLPPDIP